MKTPLSLRIASLLAVVVWSRIAIAAELEQSTLGPCSPTINGNHNTVKCNGVDPRAVARLNELLDLKDLSLKQKTEEANEWARRAVHGGTTTARGEG